LPCASSLDNFFFCDQTACKPVEKCKTRNCHKK